MNNKELCVLVDDEKIALGNLKQKIEKLKLLKIEKTYTCPDEFLTNVDDLNSKIVFLDIDMPIKGTEVAKELRGKKIIFVTGSSEINKEITEEIDDLNHTGFISKPIKDFKLKKVINKTLKELHNEKKFIILKTQDAYKEKILLNKILNINTNKLEPRDKTIHLTDGRKIIAKNIKLEKILDSLPDYFMQVNRSCIINSNYASKMTQKDEIALCFNEKEIPVDLGDSYRDNFFQKIPDFK
ncbi:LytR/AlgR family response regulator transcription factor [Aureivirga sp. CE67]|uniref:LytR/AlgR family response regulator transcription factor n=1 Tax=Aureivirga sp. CE67 TaxID=1788983 RepID=UPI0018C9AD8B|nr:response regulator [Aureivirga sp. CE67]